jgi:hypothetical protein
MKTRQDPVERPARILQWLAAIAVGIGLVGCAGTQTPTAGRHANPSDPASQINIWNAN